MLYMLQPKRVVDMKESQLLLELDEALLCIGEFVGLVVEKSALRLKIQSHGQQSAAHRSSNSDGGHVGFGGSKQQAIHPSPKEKAFSHSPGMATARLRHGYGTAMAWQWHGYGTAMAQQVSATTHGSGTEFRSMATGMAQL